MNTADTATGPIRRVAAILVLAAAPVLIALSGAATGHADPTGAPVTSTTAPAVHPAFPYQDNMPQPGTQTHHDHQNNHG